jgi:hypothetical protein
MRPFGVFLGGRRGWLAEAGGQDVTLKHRMALWVFSRPGPHPLRMPSRLSGVPGSPTPSSVVDTSPPFRAPGTTISNNLEPVGRLPQFGSIPFELVRTPGNLTLS